MRNNNKINRKVGFMKKSTNNHSVTAGFTTNAILSFEDNKLISVEDVVGNKNGITKVKAVIELFQNGDLRNASKYLMNGSWIDGHEIYYKETPGAEVIFK